MSLLLYQAQLDILRDFTENGLELAGIGCNEQVIAATGHFSQECGVDLSAVPDRVELDESRLELIDIIDGHLTCGCANVPILTV